KAKMRQEIDITNESAPGMPALLSRYGDALIKHSEYKEALGIFERCQKLMHNDPTWFVYTSLQMATCEHHIYLTNSSIELHIDNAKDALKTSKTLQSEQLRTALLTAILGNMYADIGNLETADQYFDDADKLLGEMK